MVVEQPVEEFFDLSIANIDNALDQLIPETDSSHKLIFEAARYSLLGPGKRIRPILALATGQLFGISSEIIMTPACTLEMIHAYSLIHDDLPCMDNDDFRRKRPTLHRIYSEAVALLAGDFLLTKAFECLSLAPQVTSEQKLALIQTLSKAAGGNEMIGGQLLDICGNFGTLEKLQLLHQKKTGALIACAVEFATILADAPPHEVSLLRHFGKHLGLSFQIIDDILDVTCSLEKHGRSLSSDIINNKTTYVTLLGLEGAKQEAFHHIQECHQILTHFSNTDALTSIVDSIAQRVY